MDGQTETIRTLAKGETTARARREGPRVILEMTVDGHRAEMGMTGQGAVKLAEILLRHGKAAAEHAAMAGM